MDEERTKRKRYLKAKLAILQLSSEMLYESMIELSGKSKDPSDLIAVFGSQADILDAIATYTVLIEKL